MYKVFIVDIDKNYRNYLASRVEKSAQPFEVVAQFDDGVEVRTAIFNQLPDLVIAGAFVPYVDGATLASDIKKAGLNTKVVIIGGKLKWDFVSHSLDCGVSAVLSADCTKAQFDDMLSKVKNILENEDTANHLVAEIESIKSANADIIMQKSLSMLLNLDELDKHTINRFEKLNINLNKNCAVLALIDYDEERIGKLFTTYDSALFATKYYFQSITKKNFDCFIFAKNDKIAVLLLSDKKIAQIDLESIFEKLLVRLKSMYSFKLTIALSMQYQHNINFNKLYLDAESALQHRLIMGGNKLIFYNKLNDDGVEFKLLDEQRLYQLSEIVRYGDERTIKEELQNIFNIISGKDYFASYHVNLIDMFNTITKACNSPKTLYNEYASLNKIFEKFAKLKTKDQAFSYMLEIAMQVNIVNQKVKLNALQKNYVRITEYISQHYNNASLSLDILSNDLGLSISYISTLLANNGTTFKKMLTSVRIEKAKVLLENNENKSSAIAEKVGYSDPYYFSNCFKKTTGLSPREFRNKVRKAQKKIGD